MSYPSDLTAAHGEQIDHHFQPRARRGSGPKHPKKQIVDGILYVVPRASTAHRLSAEERGIDGHKRIKGRKRHIVVDTLGNLLHVQVPAANQADTLAGCAVLERMARKYPTIVAFCGDQGYRGTAGTFVHEQLDLVLHIAPRLGEGFVVQPKRWIVEWTFAWLGHFRRVAKEVEILTGTAENVIRIAMLKITLAKC